MFFGWELSRWELSLWELFGWEFSVMGIVRSPFLMILDSFLGLDSPFTPNFLILFLKPQNEALNLAWNYLFENCLFK